MYFLKLTTRVSSTRNGRDPAAAWEGPGAPKFLKNWLTFAHSPYAPDHIFPPGGALRPRGAGPLIGTAFSSVYTKTWESF